MNYLVSVLLNKCPKCKKGNLFTHGAYNLKHFSKMHPECEHCKTDFQKEPGFYFGAAYVSYGLTVALWVALYVALYCFNAWGLIEYEFLKNPNMFMISGVVLLIVLLPVVYRLSRSLWLSWFVK